ncbi:MAG: type IV pilin, partial [Halobacteriaceae archaeon]
MSDPDPTRADRVPRPGDRAVSPVVGAVLMLAVLLLAVTVIQVTAIPILNAQHEFEHRQAVQADMVRLDTAVDRVAATGRGETATVDVGVRYPERLLFVNPPPVSGTLGTSASRSVTIANAVAAGETGDYWNGDARTFTTTTLVYSPSYNEYGNAPTTVYEPWVVYNRMGGGGGMAALTETDLVEGRQISLVALDGEYSRSTTRTVGINAVPNSAPVNTVTVRNETAPIPLTVETGLQEDAWARLLDDELDRDGAGDDRYVTGFDCRQAPPEPCGELTLTLEPGTYELRLGEVAVGSGSSREGAAYLTAVEGSDASVPETGRQRLVVEARDRFDNPVSGVTVTGTLEGDDGTLRTVTPVTENDGRAVFVYEAPENVDGTRTVTATTRFGAGDQQRTVTFDIRVVDLGGGGTGDGTDGGATSASAVEPVGGSVDSRNIAGGDRGREASFAITA